MVSSFQQREFCIPALTAVGNAINNQRINNQRQQRHAVARLLSQPPDPAPPAQRAPHGWQQKHTPLPLSRTFPALSTGSQVCAGAFTRALSAPCAKRVLLTQRATSSVRSDSRERTVQQAYKTAAKIKRRRSACRRKRCVRAPARRGRVKRQRARATRARAPRVRRHDSASAAPRRCYETKRRFKPKSAHVARARRRRCTITRGVQMFQAFMAVT